MLPPAPDTKLDICLADEGFRSLAVSGVKTYHLRHLSLGKMVSGQITSGRARFALGVSFKRTIGHSVLRVRPLILQGWMLEWMNRNATKEKPAKK